MMKHVVMFGLAVASCAAALVFTAANAQPVASAEEGHAIYSLHCARCHGDKADGGDGGPALRSRVHAMSEAAFAAKVLQRYHWTMPATGAGSEDAARDAFVQGVLRLRQDDRAMPAWESEPEVASSVRSLYVYLDSLPPH